jgi:hypothetical protein
VATTRQFDLSDLKAYPGPSVPLAIEAVTFELSYGPELPIDDLWPRVVHRFP